MTLAEMGHELRTQDNAITADPIFYVEQKGRFGQWERVQPFLTRKGAERYIDSNRHNLKAPRIFVGSAYRNPEWQAIRRFLMEMA